MRQNPLDIAKGDAPFVINTRIGYGGDTRSDISLKPLNYENAGEKVAFSGGEFQLTPIKTVMWFRCQAKRRAAWSMPLTNIIRRSNSPLII